MKNEGLAEYLFSLYNKKVVFPGLLKEVKTGTNYPKALLVLRATLLSENYKKNPVIKNLRSLVLEMYEKNYEIKKWSEKIDDQKKILLIFSYKKSIRGG